MFKSAMGFVVIFLIVTLCLSAAFAEIRQPLAPVYSRPDSLPIPGKYIVVLKTPEAYAQGIVVKNQMMLNKMSAQDIKLMHHDWLLNLMEEEPHITLDHIYGHDEVGFEGYSIFLGLNYAATLTSIRERQEVDFIEEDQIVGATELLLKKAKIYVNGQLHGLELNTKATFQRFAEAIDTLLHSGISEVTQEEDEGIVHTTTTALQNDAPWGLSRLSTRQKPKAYDGHYKFPDSAGENVDVYVIDTGINVSHEEFSDGKRAKWGKTIPLYDSDIDGNGHGTHVAGTVAGKRYGVAKKANVIAVKVLRTNGFGSNSDVIKGVEWTIKAAKKARKEHKKRRAAANMSLGGGKSKALDIAVNAAVYKGGIHFAVAAGNDAADACMYSPAGAEGPISVGASNSDDQLAYFSNIGTCVDIFAPGVEITSAWIGSNTATNTISGTSMASPHVAGVLALYLGEKDWSTLELKKKLIETATNQVLIGLPADTTDKLLSIVNLLDE